VAITDHSKSLRVAHGLDAARLDRQADAIDSLNEKLHGIRLLKGVEVEILEDGTLDLPDSVLARLDVVVAAVHSGFHLPRSRQTDRILRAIDHKHFSVLAHPTGRLIGERAPMDFDMARVLRHAHQRGCFLELNADPRRVDLNDVLCRMAKAEGVRVAVSSDAHAASAYAALRFGIGQARRAWLERDDVLNTRSLTELRKLLTATTG
ncbi:MAG TPA: PHP domain-containing protein, partial [Rudaea sp.]|nr:PHP domain-containing protein [Rudaea sp.]